ncbi:hypothetical protein [Neolewinella persica]|uniref:hypothetical protein n=1 Tax=Neolewinella persica TaxID=70998 RepID=UPI000365D0C2|nr:hypothetical protein [Neolewinella persica]
MRTLLFLTLLTLAACGSTEEDPVNIRLTMDERQRIDDLVKIHMDSIRPIVDSLCKATFADRVAVATDSIIQRRLEEEARLRARIPQNLRQ